MAQLVPIVQYGQPAWRGSCSSRAGPNPQHEVWTCHRLTLPAEATRRRFLSQAAGVAAGGTVLAGFRPRRLYTQTKLSEKVDNNKGL